MIDTSDKHHITKPYMKIFGGFESSEECEEVVTTEYVFIVLGGFSGFEIDTPLFQKWKSIAPCRISFSYIVYLGHGYLIITVV